MNKLGDRKKIFLSRGVIGVVLLLFAFLLSMQCANTLWYRGNTLTDSSVFMYVARVILDGGMPYLDTFDHKGPLIYIINVIGIIISEYRGIYVIEFCFILLTFIGFYKIARLKCNRRDAILVVFIVSSAIFKYFQYGNFTEEYALPFITSALYIFCDYFINNKITNFRLIVCGFSFGAVLMLRPNMIAVWFVMCIGVLIKCFKKKEYKSVRKFLVYFLLGTGIIIIPIMIWICCNGAFSDFINDYIIFNIHYSNGLYNEIIWLNREKSLLFFINDVLVLLAFIGILYKFYNEKKLFDVIYILYMVVNVILVSMSGREHAHYGMILVPSMVYPFICIIDSLNREKSKMMKFLFIAYVLIMFPIPQYMLSVDKMFTDYANRNNTYFEEPDVKIVKLIKENTTSKEKIIVCGNRNIYYNLSDRFAASKYSFQCAATRKKERYKEFFDDLKKNKPKVVIMTNDYTPREDMDVFLKKYKYKTIWKNGDGTKEVYVFKED